MPQLEVRLRPGPLPLHKSSAFSLRIRLSFYQMEVVQPNSTSADSSRTAMFAGAGDPPLYLVLLDEMCTIPSNLLTRVVWIK